MSTEQQVVTLRDDQKLKWTEIGDKLGISRDAARRAYSRGSGAAMHTTADYVPDATGPTYVFNEAEIAVKKGDFKRWAKRADWPAIIEELRASVLEDIRAEAHERFGNIPLGQPNTEGLLLAIAPVDAHFGKLSWPDETGSGPYDVTIADRDYRGRIEDILARVKAANFSIGEIALIVGNDALQTDNLAGTTTGGTYVDTDTRYIRSFRRARRSHSWAIRRLAEVAPKVSVIVVPGNHDRLTAFHLGEVLAAEFADHPNVVVDNSPKLRKYKQFGVCLLGWTHGSEEKVADLPLIMAQEEREMWAATKWREWHIGHGHKVRQLNYTAADSFNGVRVRMLPALCEPDAWHYQHGYVGENRATEAYLWSATTGYVGHLSSNAQTPPLP